MSAKLISINAAFGRLRMHYKLRGIYPGKLEKKAMASAVQPPETALSFLKELGADQIPHLANRFLLEHLIETYGILADWNHEDAVTLAGLMHSVYGTIAFQRACLAPSERQRLRAVIGERAERLVYLFGAMDRDLFLDHLGSNHIVSRFGDGEIEVSDEETRIMCEILFANDLDLAIAKKGADRPDKIEKKLGPLYRQTVKFLTPAAQKSYREAIRT